jgi:hypothetical protein
MLFAVLYGAADKTQCVICSPVWCCSHNTVRYSLHFEVLPKKIMLVAVLYGAAEITQCFMLFCKFLHTKHCVLFAAMYGAAHITRSVICGHERCFKHNTVC